MKVIKRIGLLFLFSLAGAIIMYWYSSASMRGAFVKWESLGKPAGRVVKLLGLGYVQTDSGEIYQYVKLGCPDNCWVKSDNPPSDSEYWFPLNYCADLPPLDDFVDSITVCRYWGPGAFILNADAIDGEGYVYSCDVRRGELDGVLHALSPLFGAIAGFLIATPILLFVLFSDLLKWLEKRAQQRNVPDKA